MPEVNVDHLNLDITPEDPRTFLQTMYELIYLAFKTDTTRVALINSEEKTVLESVIILLVLLDLNSLISFPMKQKNLMGIRILENITGSLMKSLDALLPV